MNVVDFTYSHIPEAAALALAGYREECCHVPDLPPLEAVPGLAAFAGNGLGVAAFEEDRMIGFLCGRPPCDNVFGSTDVKGVFSPMGANAAKKEKRAKIYAAMYEAAGAKWMQAGAVSHAVCLYAHDEEVQQQFYRYGFGLRCMDAVRLMEPFDCVLCEGYEFLILKKEEYSYIYPLTLLLNQHFHKSPILMNRRMDTPESFMQACETENIRYFAAKQNNQICAFVKISDPGETFVAGVPQYRHINDAYCLPEHRGKGLYQNLLNFTISTLKAEGYNRLGVDFESFNPAAYGFWLKYFSAYTHGVVRRIDEKILELYV